MTVKKWIITLCSLAVLGIVAMLGANFLISGWVFRDVTMPSIVKALRGQYEYGLKSVVELEAQNLAQALKGVKDPAEQYRIIERETDYQRFFPQDEGYFFTYNLKGMRINVPVNKSGNGKDLSGLKDHNGVMIVQEFIKAVKNGGGFVEYHFDKPGAGVQPKLSYVALIPGTDCLIGTGVYIDGVEANQTLIEAEVSKRNGEFRNYEMALGVLLLLILAFMAWKVISLICVPLTHLTQEASRVAEGHLDTEIDKASKSPREIRSLSLALGEMIANMRNRIQEAAQRTKEATEAMHKAKDATEDAEKARASAEHAHREGMLSAAEKLETIVEALSKAAKGLSERIEASGQGADNAAHRLSEAATAMHEMNATVQEVARNASSASTASIHTREKAQEGARVVEQSLQSIEDVRNISRQLKSDMGLLNEHSQNITRIMGVISDIADQTNLLALNAAIEAARAGEAGRGFAVVADEVRKLAEKTMASTSDVSSAINAIQQSTEKSMLSVDSAVAQVDKATELAGESGEALKEIVDTVEATADQVHAIATASEEQSAASEEINQSITEVNGITHSSAEAMHEAEEALHELMAEVQGLDAMIHEMKQAKA